MNIKILAVGDVCGEPGLACLEKNLRNYKKENGIAFAVVNGENANVVGITPKQADAISAPEPMLSPSATTPGRVPSFSPIWTSAGKFCVRQTSAPSARARGSMSILPPTAIYAF